MAPGYSASGDRAAQTLSLQYAVDLIRRASKGGVSGATKQDVTRAVADSPARATRTVMSMRGGAPMPAEYYGRTPLQCNASRDMCGGAPMPAEYYGRTPLMCNASRDMCGGASAAGVVTLAALKDAVRAEGIRATPFALKEARDQAAMYVKGTLEPLLKNDYPRAKSWTAAQVAACVKR